MARIDDLLVQAVQAAGPKPADDAPQKVKNPWVGKISNTLAVAIAAELRHRGMKQARPGAPGDLGLSGAERRLAGGIGAKRVDVSWATEESGLLLACSVKTIMFRDASSGAYQKNLTNRRGDLLVEAVTLHRRFPYAVLAGFLFLDHHAAKLSRRFDANSYVVLTEAMNSHDVGRDRGGVAAALGRVTARTTVVAVDSDRLYPVRLSEEMVAALPRASAHLISSPYWHDGFLIEIDQVGAVIRAAVR